MAADGKLEFCLDSLVNQTIQDIEILAVDDASTDNSAEILASYEARFPGKVKVLRHEKNKRQGGAKNTGLAAASGEWIGFVDSDDWVTPDYYEKLLTKAMDTGADMVGCDYNLVSEHTFKVGEVVANNSQSQTGCLDEEKHKALMMRPGSMVIKVYKADVIRENHLDFPEGIFYEDNCAGSVWSYYFKHYEKLDEPMYYYYQHNVSTVHRITTEKCMDRMAAAICLYEESTKRGFMEQYLAELEYRFAELYYINTLFSYMQGVKHPKLSFVKKLLAGVEERFPHFTENPYYQELTGAGEKKLIDMQRKSDLLFYVYYRLQLLKRSLRG
jgi:glycosyltransferase involved in cell wall biosynthesis